MADKFFGAGTVSAVASGDISPTNPSSLALDDILMCCLSQHDNVVATMPAGWTRIVAQNNTAALRLDTWWRRVTNAAESDDVVTVTRAAGDAGIAEIVAFRGLVTSGNPYNTAASVDNGFIDSVTMPTVTPSAAGQTIVFVGAVADDSAFGAVSGTDPAPTERHDSLTSLGADASLLIATGERSVATATGDRGSAIDLFALNCGAQIALTTAGAAVTAELTGTAIGGITEADIIAGGKTIIVTMDGDTFIA